MRNRILFCLMPVLLLLASSAAVQAQFIFVTNNGAITITGYTGNPKSLDIPSATNGYTVSTIGDSALEFFPNLTNVTIPDSIKDIQSFAFEGDSSLTSITIPNSVTNIGDWSFSDCSDITNVVMGNGLTRIGDGAFDRCFVLTNVMIGNNVLSIGDSAFAESGLTNVVIPASVTNLGNVVFLDCAGMTAINVDPENPAYSSSAGILFDKNQKIIIECPCAGSGNYDDLPNTVTTIGDYAFADVTVTSITIPNSVTNIGSFAFQGDGLTSVVIPSSVNSIDEYAFQNCLDLTNVIFGSGPLSIGNNAFEFCARLTQVTIPASVSHIGDLAFYLCLTLPAIMVDTNNPFYCSVAGGLLNKSQTVLLQYPPGNEAENYTVPNTVTTIDPYAFYNCKASRIILPENLTSIGEYTFADCFNLDNFTIPEDVTNLGDYAFYRCLGLTSFKIPNNVIRIGEGAFESCSALTNLTIGKNVTAIGNSAFEDCTGLTNIVIPCALTNIGASAFQDCGNLVTATILSGNCEIENYAFLGCGSLTGVFFGGNSPNFGLFVFGDDDSAIAYFLPGTSDWSDNSTNLPTVAWNPQIQTNDGSFGALNSQFGFNITGNADIPIVVEASTNLGCGWIPLVSTTLTDGSFYFSDPQWTNYPGRFYRIRSP